MAAPPKEVLSPELEARIAQLVTESNVNAPSKNVNAPSDLLRRCERWASN
jgi:hypothetical protein